METLQFLQDFGGLIVGALLLIVASMVLPRKVRVYVLTAGLAVIAYGAYQRVTNKRRFREADRRRWVWRHRVGWGRGLSWRRSLRWRFGFLFCLRACCNLLTADNQTSIYFLRVFCLLGRESA